MESCDAQQQSSRALIQEKLAMFGVQCEDMCKEMGVYPKCQCPGFAGQPADGDDNRACIAKNCQDPSSPCPNDAFMTCVHETTKVSTLQWDSLIQKFDNTMALSFVAIGRPRVPRREQLLLRRLEHLVARVVVIFLSRRLEGLQREPRLRGALDRHRRRLARRRRRAEEAHRCGGRRRRRRWRAEGARARG